MINKNAARLPKDPEPAAGKGEIVLGPLENNVGFHLRLAAISMDQVRRHTTGTDLPMGHFPVLFIIRQNPEATQTAIATAVGLQRSSLVPVLNKLEKFGWIERAEDVTDRRANRLRLTPAGEQACDDLLDGVTLTEEIARKKIGPRKYERLVELLRDLQTALED